MSVWGERLDAAAAQKDQGNAFLGVLQDLFGSLSRARDEDEQDRQIREAW